MEDSQERNLIPIGTGSMGKSMKGLAKCSQIATKVSERYLSSWGLLLRTLASNP